MRELKNELRTPALAIVDACAAVVRSREKRRPVSSGLLARRARARGSGGEKWPGNEATYYI